MSGLVAYGWDQGSNIFINFMHLPAGAETSYLESTLSVPDMPPSNQRHQHMESTCKEVPDLAALSSRRALEVGP